MTRVTARTVSRARAVHRDRPVHCADHRLVPRKRGCDDRSDLTRRQGRARDGRGTTHRYRVRGGEDHAGPRREGGDRVDDRPHPRASERARRRRGRLRRRSHRRGGGPRHGRRRRGAVRSGRPPRQQRRHVLDRPGGRRRPPLHRDRGRGVAPVDRDQPHDVLQRLPLGRAGDGRARLRPDRERLVGHRSVRDQPGLRRLLDGEGRMDGLTRGSDRGRGAGGHRELRRARSSTTAARRRPRRSPQARTRRWAGRARRRRSDT